VGLTGPITVGGQRIGLLGGSFDPVHVAHLQLAAHARDQLALQQVLLVPAAQPWQREALGATAAQRLEMLRIATADQPGLGVSDLEIRRGGPTYTIDTLRALPAGHEYYWILGADQLQNLCTRKDWQHIASTVNLAVAARPGSALQAPPALQAQLDALGRRLHVLSMPPTDVSATLIRQRLAEGGDTQGMLHPGVAKYIRQHGLYRHS